MDIRSCTVIGAGNVAWHISQALAEHINIRQVFSRDHANASLLADKIGAQPVSDLSEIAPGADFYLISVPDDHIPDVIAATAGIKSGIWAHTSGSMPIDVFDAKKDKYGVFYPLQTFSKTKQVDISQVPMLIEGSDDVVASTLRSLAENISANVRLAGSPERKQLHVAAVFACNFVNYMWIQADSLLRKAGLDFSMLKPLLSETLNKLDDLPPIQAQTGPARRGDFLTVEKHLGMLSPEQAEIYRLLTDKIHNLYHNNNG